MKLNSLLNLDQDNKSIKNKHSISSFSIIPKGLFLTEVV